MMKRFVKKQGASPHRAADRDHHHRHSVGDRDSALFESARQAKDASMKEATHTIQIGIQTWATDKNDTYPSQTQVNVGAENVGQYVDSWPQNPYGTGS